MLVSHTTAVSKSKPCCWRLKPRLPLRSRPPATDPIRAGGFRKRCREFIRQARGGWAVTPGQRL